jgi:hypothetical protein
LDAECSSCLTGLLSPSATHTTTGTSLDSATCRAANTTLLLSRLVDANCYNLPSCSFSKRQCAISTECTQCMPLLAAGNGSGAASQCNQGEPESLIDTVARWCVDGTTATCAFWETRCLADEMCGPCLGKMQFGRSVDDIVVGSTALECAAIRSNRTTSAVAAAAFETLYNVALMCPDELAFSDCGTAVLLCVLSHDQCAGCVNGSTPDSDEE